MCGNRKASNSKFSLCEKLRNSSPVEFIKVENINGFKEGWDKVRLGSITVIKHGSHVVPGSLIPYYRKPEEYYWRNASLWGYHWGFCGAVCFGGFFLALLLRFWLFWGHGGLNKTGTCAKDN